MNMFLPRQLRRGCTRRAQAAILIWIIIMMILNLAIKLIHLTMARSQLDMEPPFDETLDEILGRHRITPGTKGHYKIPTFMIIGAQKAGTTALTYYLQEHPLINPVQRKELHFFDKGGQHMQDYLEEFPDSAKDGKQMTFDASPNYILESNKILRKIRRICPWVKFILILRNPVDRAYSHYAMTWKSWTYRKKKNLTHTHKMSFDEYLDLDYYEMEDAGLLPAYADNDSTNMTEFYGSKAEDAAWRRYLHAKTSYVHHSVLARGMYSVQLRQWFKYFPRDQFLIMNYDDMRTDSGALDMYERIVDFLGLPKHTLTVPEERIFGGKYSTVEPMSDETQRWLEDFYAPYTSQLPSILGEEWNDVWQSRLAEPV